MPHPRDLPKFKYHPDPIKTEMVVPSDGACVCCGKTPGFMYAGPVYATEEYVEEICPWCIADGSAHSKLEAEFTDPESIGAGPGWDQVSEEVIAEVSQRTPGFSGWQQECWWTHCGDAAQFLGRAGRDELSELGNEAISAIRASTGIQSDEEWGEFFAALDKDGSPTAYLFRCAKCGAIGGYQDSD
ncbi:MAG: CbrC family protein [Phycisphaerales bacterium]